MTEILEAIMLVCFGLSWPISLIRNIQQKTAAGMNIYFILLIILGYLAGITAKLISHQFTYVLAFYILNLLIVSGNVPVYFRNKRYDKMQADNRHLGHRGAYRSAVCNSTADK